MHEHLERATAHSLGMKLSVAVITGFVITGFWDQILKTNFPHFGSIAHCLTNSAGNRSCVSSEPPRRAGGLQTTWIGCMPERKESSSCLERYAKEGGSWAFIPLSLCYSKYSHSNLRTKWKDDERSGIFLNALPYCTASAFVLRLNLDSLLPFFNSHIWPTPERCPFEASSNESLLFEGTLLNELSYSLQTSYINSSLMENEILRCKVKGEVQNVMTTRDWEVCS